MITTLIALASVGAYLTAGVFTARQVWAKYRPHTEPIHCKHWSGCSEGKHRDECYRWKEDSYLDVGEAKAIAALAVFVWPAFGPVMLLLWLITRAPVPRQEELKAKTERLEREVERLRRQQEKQQ